MGELAQLLGVPLMFLALWLLRAMADNANSQRAADDARKRICASLDVTPAARPVSTLTGGPLWLGLKGRKYLN